MNITILPNNITFQKHDKTKTLEKKHRELAKLFSKEGLKLKDVEKAAKKFPPINNYHPTSIEYNVREFVKLFKKYGLTTKDYLKMAKLQPTLLASKPETLALNIEILHNYLKKYGITKDDIIKITKTTPSFLSMSPHTLIKNFMEIIEYYKDYGLDGKDYIKGIKKSFLITKSFKNFKKREETITKHFACLGMETKDFITLFKKQIVALALNEEKILNKLDIWTYIETEKLDDEQRCIRPRELLESILRKNLSHSNETNFLYLLRCKLNKYYDMKLHSKNMKEEIPKLLKDNPDRIYEIPVLNHKFAKDFEKVITDFSNKTIKKNAFKIIFK